MSTTPVRMPLLNFRFPLYYEQSPNNVRLVLPIELSWNTRLSRTQVSTVEGLQISASTDYAL